ncbi:MAG TPA: hypothetical protein VG455_16325 [Acidimicrobiales bacterium]|nr:hypothetical protein [Acidimicrobiales bacterium]
MEDTNLTALSLLVGPCPECGNGRLRAVSDGHQANFVCETCGSCWHPELEWVNRVNPTTCPGCLSREICTNARRAYGERVADAV